MPESIEVKLGRLAKADVPVSFDRHMTEKAVSMVNARIEEIENRGGKVDDYKFALLAAVSLAVELEQERQAAAETKSLAERERKEEERELMSALTKIAASLRELLEDAQGK